uniref:U-box domain-containing protein n=1 Tax=Pavo cristatus TaxID=9049 RepID=A0A8C9G2S9_PAVCR
MVINVCLPQFKPRIHCNKISADGYEVENLISEDLARRNRGFRSEYFIKPPVHVTISFPFNIEICRINIDISSGGYQAFSGLEVYTSTSCNKTSWQSPEGQFSGLAGQPVSDKDAFTLVGKAVLKNQSKVTFGHRGFKPRPPFLQMENVLSYPGAVSQDLWNKGPSSLSNVSHLKICITHVAGGGLPGIKRLEVWGQPAKSCPQEVIEGIFQVASQCVAQDVGTLKPELWTPMESDCVPFSTNDSEQQALRKLVDVVQDIPEEFLDPITLEIMTFPMLLPSGKVIDQSTLEKCNRSEASWGRVPSDPFTGVAFSQHSQPLPHPTLKARIDHFLLQHSIPGTNLLGRAHASEMLIPSSVTSSLKRKMDCMDPSSVQPLYFSSTNLLVTSTSENSAKKMKTDSDSHLIQMDCSTGTLKTCSNGEKYVLGVDRMGSRNGAAGCAGPASLSLVEEPGSRALASLDSLPHHLLESTSVVALLLSTFVYAGIPETCWSCCVQLLCRYSCTLYSNACIFSLVLSNTVTAAGRSPTGRCLTFV